MDNISTSESASTASVERPVPAAVQVAVGDCAAGCVAVLDGEQIVVVGSPDNGQVPVVTAGSLQQLAAATLVYTDRNQDQNPSHATAIAQLYDLVRSDRGRQARLSEQLSDLRDEFARYQRRSEANLDSIRQAAIDHYKTGDSICTEGLQEFLRDHGMQPIRHRVRFTVVGSYLVEGDADADSIQDDAVYVEIDLSNVDDVVDNSLTIDDRTISVTDDA
ncbi:hypothetical protein NUM_07420 [Actinocatenispora comari]|uniref:Uncharacterized protein n=2 Tax=Actinocatenispora comari TaxID=2807577 RepID=A0A8J4AAB5_9ACTN|nr:hypothetical protein NUM_07420 [Actinocatenispora comari]